MQNTVPLMLFACVLKKWRRYPRAKCNTRATGACKERHNKKNLNCTHNSLVLPNGRASLSVTLGALAIGRIAAGALHRTQTAVLHTFAETVVTRFHGSRADGRRSFRHLRRDLLARAPRSAGTELVGVVPILRYRRLQIMRCGRRCTRCPQ